MPLQKLPVHDLDNLNHRRRARETINQVLDHSFDDSRVQTPDEIANGVTPINKAYPPGNVLRYGADNNADITLVDSTTAIRQALLANTRIYFPPGFYIVSETILIHGEFVIITGEFGGTQSSTSARIFYSGSGELFDATGTEFGGVYIGHIRISGGSGDGEPAIRSTRPQSVFERVYMEDYDNPGIVISSSTQGSWAGIIRSCKWTGPSSGPHVKNAYTGFDISINGGFYEVDDVAATLGNIGVNINQGECIRLSRVICNRQNSTYSNQSSVDGQCGIRLTGSIGGGGTNYKRAISIHSSYVEACTTGLYAESAEGLSIRDSFFDDIGEGANRDVAFGGSAIYLESGDVNNVLIDSNNIIHRSNSLPAIFNNSVHNVRVKNNYIDHRGTGPVWLENTSSAKTLYEQNTVLNSATLTDPTGTAFDMEPYIDVWTPTIGGSTTAGTQTYSFQKGRYRKFGRKVEYDGVLIMTAKDAATAGNLTIFGLPFTSRNDVATGRLYNVVIGEYSSIDLSAGKSQIGGTVNNNSTSIVLVENGDNVALAALTAAALQATTAIYFSGVYEI